MIVPTLHGDLQSVARPSDSAGPFRYDPTWSLAERNVTPDEAMGLASVYGGAMMIAQAVGTMPLETIDQTKKAGDNRITSSRLSLMLEHEPNRDMSGIDVWTYVVLSLVLRGNAYLAKLRDASGYVNELYPLQSANVTVWRAPDGRKLFRVRQLDGAKWVDTDFTEDAILHIKGPSIGDPLVGVSPITAMRQRIGAQLAQSEYQASTYGSGLLLRGVLSTPQNTLNPESVERMKTQWKQAHHGSTGDDIAVLHSGMTFQPVTMSPQDAQFIQTMKWGHTETALMLNLPPSRLAGDTGDSSRYANMAQDDLFAYKLGYYPRKRMVEVGLNRDKDLFGIQSAWIPSFNPSAHLQADPRERWEINRIRREIGAASTNMLLAEENQPGIGPAGDDFTPLKTSTTKTPAPASEGEPTDDAV